MSQFIGLEVSGIDQLLKDFKGYEREAGRAIDKAVDDTADQISKIAKERLQGMQGSSRHIVYGNLIRSIYRRTLGAMERIVGTPVNYAPYIEFGTGDLVEIPEGTEEVAAQFKGRGIRKVNIKGDSFLNFAAVHERKKLIDRITTNLNKIKK
jgi:hypothetical protein